MDTRHTRVSYHLMGLIVIGKYVVYCKHNSLTQLVISPGFKAMTSYKTNIELHSKVSIPKQLEKDTIIRVFFI